MSKQQAIKLLAGLGAKIDGPIRNASERTYQCFVDAPFRKVFDHTGTHCIGNISGETLTEFWSALVTELECVGLDDCQTPHCDICNSIEI